jgi:hypothetical protein
MFHKLHRFEFTSLAAETWDSLPDLEKLKKQIALALLAHSELTQQALGAYAPPNEIREVRVSTAAFDQIAHMWHGHRDNGQMSPPPIPLKIFVFSFGQNPDGSWASIEVLPGLDDWALS